MVDETETAADGLERKLATILSADVAAYSRLMAEDEEHTLQTFRGHKDVFEKLVGLHRGRVFNTAGDAILAEFGSAVEAVRCATEIQAALRTRNDQLPEKQRVKFRIGVNLGDVMVQGRDLLGDGVNVAARLQAAAEPGGVCISGSVYDQIVNKLSLSFQPLGNLSFKNIPQPVRTFAIADAVGLGSLPAPRRRRQRSGRWGLCAAVAMAIILIAGGAAALRTFIDWQHNRAELAQAAKLAAEQAAADRRAAGEVRQRTEAERQAAEAAQRQAELAAAERAAEEARQRAEVERREAEVAQQKALADQKRIDAEARRLAEAKRKSADVTQLAVAAMPAPPRVMPPQPEPPRSPPATPRSAPDLSGIYGGQICYGPSDFDPARCFHAQAVVIYDKISGQWPARDPGATMHLAGEVSASGDVVIHMHAERSDGSHFAIMDLMGKLREGRIDATGSFRNGRSVILNWHKN